MDSPVVAFLVFFGLIGFAALLFFFPVPQDRKKDESTDYFDTRPAKISTTSTATRSTTSTTTKSTTSTTTKSKPVEEKPSGSPQITIYEFKSKYTKLLCPFCDGENVVGTKVCNICRRDL